MTLTKSEMKIVPILTILCTILCNTGGFCTICAKNTQDDVMLNSLLDTYNYLSAVDFGATLGCLASGKYCEVNATWMTKYPELYIPYDIGVTILFNAVARVTYKSNKTASYIFVGIGIVVRGYVLYRNLKEVLR